MLRRIGGPQSRFGFSRNLNLPGDSAASAKPQICRHPPALIRASVSGHNTQLLANLHTGCPNVRLKFRPTRISVKVEASSANQASSASSSSSSSSSSKLSAASSSSSLVSQLEASTMTLPPDAIPIQLEHGAVVSEAVGVVLDRLPAGAFRTDDVAGHEHGALVLGLNHLDGPRSLLDVRIGQLKAGRMLVCARCKLWWMTPEWRSSTLQLPPETQFLLAELKRPGPSSSSRTDSVEGAYALLLPLIDGDFRTTLRAGGKGDHEGDLTLRVESGDKRVVSDAWENLLYIAVGTDPFQLIERGVTAAARLSGGALPLSQKKLPPSLDVFGWCTWDAFYSTVSARGIQDGLRSLNEGGIHPRTLIIDDGWQMTDVDPAFRKAPTSELAESLHLRAKEQRMLETTEQDFYQESLEILAETAGQLPAGTSSGNIMPGLSNLGPSGTRHIQHHSSPAAAAAAANARASGGSAAAAADAASAAVKYQVAQQDKAAVAGTVAAAEPPVVSQSEPLLPAIDASPSTGDNALYIVRVAQKVAGWFIGLGTAGYLLTYQWLVEPAAPGSLPVRWFTSLALGPLRPLLLSFFANASDFTRRLTSVRANGKFSHPDAGPDDEWLGQEDHLSSVVTAIKTRFSLDYIYCWHGLPAYWAGVMPNAPDLEPLSATIVYAEPTPGVLDVEPSMAWNPAVLAGVGVLQDPGALYNMMHSYLASSGVDGVKVDCQAGVGLVGSALGGGAALSRRFHAALESSVRSNFSDNHCLNCMCHSTENLYRMTHTSVARASDDFYPRDPASSHPHLAACAFNGLFMSVLVQPDWDMFHSKHVSARLHAMARSISGGAVYVSDKPGDHDFVLLRRLVLPDGSVLRAKQPARPTKDSLFNDVLRDGKSLCKLWTTNMYCSVVGIFHLQGSSWDRTRRKFFVHDKAPVPLTGQVRPRDVEILKTDGGVSRPSYAMYTITTRELHVVGHDQPLNITLPSATGELVVVSPIMEGCGVKFAPVGLCEMFNCGGAVASCAALPGGSGRKEMGFAVSVRGCGRFLAYCSCAPLRALADGLELLLSYDQDSGAMHLEVPVTKNLVCELKLVFSE